jgi:hypothetical protein
LVIQGQDDIVTSTPAAVDYFKCIEAPKKESILIPNAGHFAFMTASDKFLEVLTSKPPRRTCPRRMKAARRLAAMSLLEQLPAPAKVSSPISELPCPLGDCQFSCAGNFLD